MKITIGNIPKYILLHNGWVKSTTWSSSHDIQCCGLLPSLIRKRIAEKNMLVYANIYVKWCIAFAHFSVCFERAVKPTPFKRLSFSLFLLCSTTHCQIHAHNHYFFLFWFTELTTEKIAKKKWFEIQLINFITPIG